MHASCLQTRARGEGTLRAGAGQPTSPAVGRSRDHPREGIPAPNTPGPEEARQVLLVGTRKSHRLLEARADSRLTAGEAPHEQTLPPPAAKHAVQAGRQHAGSVSAAASSPPRGSCVIAEVVFLGVPLQNLHRN